MTDTQENSTAVRFDHVSKSFDTKKVLTDVSFQIKRGEAFCLLGRSGIGKSVTLRLMIGLLKPEHGEISIYGTNIVTTDTATLNGVRKTMGFLFQDAALFDSLSVADNVAFPLRRHTDKSDRQIRAVVREKLKDVELEKEENTMPSQLSGGMRKRAGLARALALDPQILLVDEPSSGLDRITAIEIYNLLQSLKKRRNVTLVVVTHDVAGVHKFADRFAVLDRGRIVGCGTYSEVENSENSLVRELAAGSKT
ncbi:MAG TPA: ATP-binding cassette domain-containing protein [Bryobacteraceae bacterium]|nr:ATP-binding cassette domain-containing protein [Bryobacteraceae bacterium]